MEGASLSRKAVMHVYRVCVYVCMSLCVYTCMCKSMSVQYIVSNRCNYARERDLNVGLTVYRCVLMFHVCVYMYV